MTHTLRIKRFRGSSVFKLILIGNGIGFSLFSTILSIPALFGLEILSWNGTYITGPMALVLGPIMGLFIGVLLGLLVGLFTYLGLHIYSLFMTLELEYVSGNEE